MMTKNLKNNNIDDEWADFLTSTSHFNKDMKTITKFEEEEEEEQEQDEESLKSCLNTNTNAAAAKAPESNELYISTKSKIAFLNQELDLKKIFWGIPIIPYSLPKEGVIKKQMKFNSLCKEELAEIKENLKGEAYFDEHVLTSIDNPLGRIKFKDIRKVSVGISRKDILSHRTKKKSAFYNCFVMILRVKIEDQYKEFHIKVFNTGKMEIPGVQNEEIYERVLGIVLGIIQPFIPSDNPLIYIKKSHTILVNSNFNCGFYINREILYNLLKYKYNIQCIYDPCSYPGIQCKYYYPALEVKKEQDPKTEDSSERIEVSFMIFRTGSILIVGMCEDDVLYHIYSYLKTLLQNEYSAIVQPMNVDETATKDKKKKVHKKKILFEDAILCDDEITVSSI